MIELLRGRVTSSQRQLLGGEHLWILIHLEYQPLLLIILRRPESCDGSEGLGQALHGEVLDKSGSIIMVRLSSG